jgi:hypothetical protein
VGRKISTGLAGGGGGGSTGTLSTIESSITPITPDSNLIVDASGTGQFVSTSPLTITNTTASGSISTGALLVSGGLGVEQNMFIGGTVNAIGGVNMPIGIAPAIHSTGVFTSLTQSGLATFTSISEISAAKTGATGTVVHDFTESNIWVHTSISANFTVNLTNVPITNDRAIVISLILVQGGTARYATGFQIDGVSVTLRYPSFNTSFTPAANKREIQTFVLTRTGSAWTVRVYFSSFGETIGTSPLNPATSATAIKTANPSAQSGLYWLQPAAWTQPALCYCEMTLHGGGWIYIMQRLCVNDQGLPGSFLVNQLGEPNHTLRDFYGVRDITGAAITPQGMWNAFIGAAPATGKFFAREIQFQTGTQGGVYSESQRYVSSSDGPIWTYTTFSRLFSGNFVNGQFQAGVTVWLDNGATQAAGKIGTTWSAPALATINNGNVDQNLYFCNGEDAGDANWSFALMKGGTPYPRLADAANGGGRHNNISRWAIIGIKA